jgi:hypothetical protein
MTHAEAVSSARSVFSALRERGAMAIPLCPRIAGRSSDGSRASFLGHGLDQAAQQLSPGGPPAHCCRGSKRTWRRRLRFLCRQFSDLKQNLDLSLHNSAPCRHPRRLESAGGEFTNGDAPGSG